MPSKDIVIRLLLVEDQLEDAERLISVLRNGGIAVRPQRPQDTAELIGQLGEGAVDLVLASLEAKSITFADTMMAVNGSGKDIPVIATAGKIEEDRVIEAIVAGARDVAVRGRPEHLRKVVRNEFDVLEDRRALRRIEAALNESERRCDSLIASSRDPIAYVVDGMHIRANEAYLQMFGYGEFEEIEGLPLLDMVASSDSDRFKQLFKDLAKGEPPPRSLELRARKADGTDFEATMEFSQAKYEGEACLQIIFRQRAINEAMVRELDALRTRDQATGLSNRKHFLEQLEAAVKTAAGGRNDQLMLLVEPDQYSALTMDIGIAHSDELLARLAARLQEVVGDNGLCSRFSDHDFAVLRTESSPRESTELAEAVRAAYEGYIIEVGGRSVSLTVSIGGVQIGEKIASLQQVLGKVGQTAKSAASLGGNRVEIFDPSAQDRAEAERIAAWVQRIREALAGDGFVLHYQPIVGMLGQPGETYECLIRMKGSGGEVIAPLTFLPIAEEHGLLDDIDRWVVETAIRTIAARKKAGKDTTLFVKVTPNSLMEGGLGAWMAEQLKTHGAPGDKLVLEIQESKVFTNLRATQELQHAIQPFGCRLALEQFGSGLNSFQLLAHVDPALLKIDRSYMTDLAKKPDNQKKLREMTDEAHRAGKQVITEFVQDAASMTTLFGIGVDYVEGHFLAAAGPDMNYDFSG